MSDQYIGEIRMFGGNYAPMGWALCDGSTLPIQGNEALFSLIGTTFGGDGTVRFALPDLRGRVPIHCDNGHRLGQQGGAERVPLTAAQLAAHAHSLTATTDHGDAPGPANARLAQAPGAIYNADLSATATLAPDTVVGAGGAQQHDNIQPFLCVTFIIALEGLYPTHD